MDRTTAHRTTRSVSFYDPDENHLAICAEKVSPDAGIRVLREGGGLHKPFVLGPGLSSKTGE